MPPETTAVMSDKRTSPLDYRCLPLLELSRRIVEKADRSALDELHSRPLFRHKQGMSLPLSEYLSCLCRESSRQGGWVNDPLVLEKAYDLTLNKFFHLPCDSKPAQVKAKQVDCRYYFRLFSRICGSLSVLVLNAAKPPGAPEEQMESEKPGRSVYSK